MPTRFRVLVTLEAETAFREIYEYIAKDNLAAAKALAVNFEDQLAALETLPHRAPFIRENFRSKARHRHLILGKYRIIFRIDQDVVVIITMIHGAMRLKKKMLF